MAASPSSSPRLPSPPPMAEDQISPSQQQDEHGQLGASNMTALNDTAASRRIRPGTKAEDMHDGPPLIPFSDIDSAFQLTEHLKALHTSYTHPSDSLLATETAIDKATARALATAPPGVDRGIWLYELCRFLTQKANAMVIALFSDDPACSASTCPEMRASEWQYLCAAHEPPKSCCAIDYCCHTLDWCATALTSSKLFPSRLSLGTETASANVQLRKMTEVFRRVYRIFAHAWFSHRDAFWRIESKTGLYLFFKTVCDEYRLIQEDNYTIPPEAEGLEATPPGVQDRKTPVPGLLRRDTVKQVGEDGYVLQSKTTRKHRHSLSTASDRSASVSTVIHEEVEEDEDDDDGWSTTADQDAEGETTVVLVEEEGDTERSPVVDGETAADEDENEGEHHAREEEGEHATTEDEIQALQPTVTVTAPTDADETGGAVPTEEGETINEPTIPPESTEETTTESQHISDPPPAVEIPESSSTTSESDQSTTVAEEDGHEDEDDEKE